MYIYILHPHIILNTKLAFQISAGFVNFSNLGVRIQKFKFTLCLGWPFLPKIELLIQPTTEDFYEIISQFLLKYCFFVYIIFKGIIFKSQV